MDILGRSYMLITQGVKGLSKHSLLSGHPLLRGHLRRSQGCPLDEGSA